MAQGAPENPTWVGGETCCEEHEGQSGVARVSTQVARNFGHGSVYGRHIEVEDDDTQVTRLGIVSCVASLTSLMLGRAVFKFWIEAVANAWNLNSGAEAEDDISKRLELKRSLSSCVRGMKF